MNRKKKKEKCYETISEDRRRKNEGGQKWKYSKMEMATLDLEKGEEKGKAKQGKKEKKNGEWRDEKNERNGVGRGLLDYANPRAVTAGGK